jgi:poly(3-hydroxyalkanoate) synthetase
MPNNPSTEPSPTPLPRRPAAVSVPAFWPMLMAAELAKVGMAVLARNLKFVAEEIKIHEKQRPTVATPNAVRLDLRTMTLRDYGRTGGIPTVVDAPYAGHSAVIADYAKGQSLIETLLANGVGHVVLTDWKSAADDMKDFDIDNYLAELIVAIDDLGGRVNLVGLCQGGWLSAMAAARFPEKVNALVLAGALIDTDAGDGPIKRMSHGTPMAFYEDLVRLGGGLMKGEFMLQGWKNMHPDEHYFKQHVDLYEHIDDPVFVAKRETFERWYESPVDLPGRWYLQAIRELFKENRFAKGEFIGLGRRLDLKAIVCPVYLMAGDSDDITSREQVFDAEKYLGTPKERIEKKLVPGGHIGLFMGSKTLNEAWPSIAQWMVRAGA